MPTEAVESFRADLRGRWGTQIQDLGVHACRQKRSRSGETIGGWSQHAWGNAWDFRVPAALRGQVAALLDSHEAVAGFIDYGDGQFHVDGSPRMDTSSTPPCAGGDTPDVMNPPTEGGTAEVPGPGSPDDTETIDSGIREGSPADQAAEAVSGPLSDASDLLSALADADTWKRVLLIIGGLVALIAGIVILARDLIPTGRLAGAAAGAVKGATS